MGLSPEAVAEWTPSIERLPDAGRFMYRVDVTMDEPIKSTILCGPCGHLETVDGLRPKNTLAYPVEEFFGQMKRSDFNHNPHD